MKRSLLAFLGLSKEAKVTVRTDDVDITIVGNQRHVQHMLKAVKAALEELLDENSVQRIGAVNLEQGTESLVVRPTELDEFDSPYAIPEHRTVEKIEKLTLPDETSADELEEETNTHEQFTDTEPSGESITNPNNPRIVDKD